MACIRMSRAIVRWERSSLEQSKTTFVVPNARSGFPARTKWGPGFGGRPWTAPPAPTFSDSSWSLRSPSSSTMGSCHSFGRRVGIRETPAYFLAIALVPVALWLVPAFSRALARGAYEAHRKLFGGDAVDVRLPAAEPVRLRDTILMSIGPFAIDLLVMAEIE